MHFKTFSEEQLNDLRSNPNVESVTDKRICYTQEFKTLFIQKYREGIGPSQIFREAGFDINALGYKRIERASDRWRHEYNEGLSTDNIDYVQVHERRKRNREDTRTRIARQNEYVEMLEAENRELRRRLNAIGKALQ